MIAPVSKMKRLPFLLACIACALSTTVALGQAYVSPVSTTNYYPTLSTTSPTFSATLNNLRVNGQTASSTLNGLCGITLGVWNAYSTGTNQNGAQQGSNIVYYDLTGNGTTFPTAPTFFNTLVPAGKGVLTNIINHPNATWSWDHPISTTGYSTSEMKLVSQSSDLSNTLYLYPYDAPGGTPLKLTSNASLLSQIPSNLQVDGNFSAGGNTILRGSANELTSAQTLLDGSNNLAPQRILSVGLADGRYLTQSSASSTYLTQSSASSTYLAQSSASSTYLTIANASSTYLTQAAAASTYVTQASAAVTGTLAVAGNATLSGSGNEMPSQTLYNGPTLVGARVLTVGLADARYLAPAAAASTYLAQADAASTYLTQATASTLLQAKADASDYYNKTDSDSRFMSASSPVIISSFVVQGRRDPDQSPTTTTIIPKAGQDILVPEQGDISMGEFRSGVLPVAAEDP